MSFELKEGQGSLFENDKGDNAKRPDRRGEILLGGVLYELSGWIKVGNSGKRFLSLSGKPKQQSQRDKTPALPPRQAPKRNAYAERDNGFEVRDEDIPF